MREYAAVKISEHIFKDDIGQLICTECIIAREGEQRYKRSDLPKFSGGPDYEVVVKRPWKSVSEPQAMASFEAKPLVVYHPDKPVDIHDIKDKQVGYAKDVAVAPYKVQGYNAIMCTIVIYDKDVIEKVLNKELRELSCSYDCEIDMDTLEINSIRGNHIALVPVGRAEIARIQDAGPVTNSIMDAEDMTVYPFISLEGFKHVLQTIIAKNKFRDSVRIKELRFEGRKIEYIEDMAGWYRRVLEELGFDDINENDELVKYNRDPNQPVVEIPPVPDNGRDTIAATFGDAVVDELTEVDKSYTMRSFTVVVHRIGWDSTVRHKLITRLGVGTDVVITKPAVNPNLGVPGAKHIFKLDSARIPSAMQVMHEFHKLYAKEIVAKYNFDEFGNATDHKLIPWSMFQMFFTLEFKLMETTLEEDPIETDVNTSHNNELETSGDVITQVPDNYDSGESV